MTAMIATPSTTSSAKAPARAGHEANAGAASNSDPVLTASALVVS
jgi:hypothetical protein